MSTKHGDAAPNRCPLPPLSTCLLLAAQRGDPAYLAKPAAGEFAVLHIADGTKRFYAAPRSSDALGLVLLIEDAFRAPAERVEEFVWVI